MKKLVFILLCFAGIQFSAFADKPITRDQLPTEAKDMITRHFSNLDYAYATMDDDIFDVSYIVGFSEGTKIEFDNLGRWIEIESPGAAIPQNLIPAEIVRHINSNYPNTGIKSIERGRKGYEVKLTNGLELKYNRSYQLVDIDD